MEFGKKYRFTAHVDYIHPCWAIHIYNSYYIAYIDGVNYGWIADPKAFAKKMKAYQLPRKSGTMKIKKVTIWGEEEETYEVTYKDKSIHITGPNGYELEGTNRGEVQRKFNLHHNPFNML